MNFVLVLEYCAHGSLHDLLIKKKKKLPLLVIVGMARDAALGILHLHKVGHYFTLLVKYLANCLYVWC